MSRVCNECGATVMRGDGGVRVPDRLFCSEQCADDGEGDGEDYTNRDFDHEAAIHEDFFS